MDGESKSGRSRSYKSRWKPKWRSNYSRHWRKHWGRFLKTSPDSSLFAACSPGLFIVPKMALCVKSHFQGLHAILLCGCVFIPPVTAKAIVEHRRASVFQKQKNTLFENGSPAGLFFSFSKSFLNISLLKVSPN